jgi:hypothetical protein
VKRLFYKLIFFTIPIAVFFLIPLYVLFISKERLFSIDKLLCSNDKYLIGYAYSEDNYGYLKWKYVNLNSKKEIWALGSSRVLQFRKGMFDESFYNLGYSISKINEFIPFLKSVPTSKYPKYLIIGLDQWMFNSKWDDLKSKREINYWENCFKFYPEMNTYKSVYMDLINRKYDFNSLYNGDQYCIGLNALVNDVGFREDGSMLYGNQIRKLIKKDTSANDYNYTNTITRIKNGNKRFEYGSTINDNAIFEVNEVLKYCKKWNINVIAILPPFAPSIFKIMKKSGNYNYVQNLFANLKPYFDKYDYELYDFTNSYTFNSNDNEFIDGFHGGEIVYQKILINMLDSGSMLNEVSELIKLKSTINQKNNNFLIYSY